jgi:AcrR family transcriptional regulator
VADGVKRTYRSDRRREQAEQTRSRILDAAAAGFLERGYERASISSIAAAAGVADETVYSHFGNKRTLLGAVMQRAVRGADPRPISEQRGPQALAAMTDQRAQLRRFARDVTERIERVSPLFAVIVAAAPGEPELAELRSRLHADRLRNMRLLTGALERNGPLRLPAAEAAEVAWALASPELHQLLTGTRGWSRRRYTTWLARSLEALLLP